MAVKYKKIQANVDYNIALEAEGILEQLGINTSTAINTLFRQIIQNGGLPYELKVDDRSKVKWEIKQRAKNIPTRELNTDKQIEEWFNEEDY